MTAPITTTVKRTKIQQILDKKYSNANYPSECNVVITFEDPQTSWFQTGDINKYRKETTRNQRVRDGIEKNKATFDRLKIPKI